jgi:type IV secretory pathway TrbD component
MRPTYRVLNKHLTLCGCDRQLFIAGLFAGFGLFATLTSLTAGLVTFACFVTLGRLKAKDVTAFRVMFNPGGHKNRYDAAIRHPFPVTYHAQNL